MKYIFLAALILILAPIYLFASGNQKTNSYKKISQAEAYEMMQENSNIMILDVRTPEEFASGHIKNAINIPNESIGNSIVNKLTDKNAAILIYCRSGNRSKQAASKLEKLGYGNIYEFGGINTWKYGIVK